MNKLVFIIILLVLFTIELLDPVQNHVILPFTEALAMVSATLLHLFDSDVLSSGIIIQSISKNVAIAIEAGCNGIEAVICLIAAVFAFQASWKEKFFGIVAGFFAIQALNIIRIVTLFYLLQWNIYWFEWAHLYAWQALIFLDVLIVFIVWIRWTAKRKTATFSEKLNHA